MLAGANVVMRYGTCYKPCKNPLWLWLGLGLGLGLATRGLHRVYSTYDVAHRGVGAGEHA